MKTHDKKMICSLTFLALAASVHAQSPSEQLQQMVVQLQKTPDDNVLRERIIKHVAQLKPAMVIPDKAIEHEGRAQAAFANAKSRTGFVSAVNEYEKAVAAAPWVIGYYYDLCTIYEKAGIHLEARRNCQHALMAELGSSEQLALKRRIAGLGLLAEQNSEQTLRANYSYPLPIEIDAAKWPAGTRYFCEAWGREGENYARRETWLVYNSQTLIGVHIGWASAEYLAKTFRNYGSERYEISQKAYRRDPGKARSYDELNNPGIQVGWVLEISGDESAIHRSNAYGRQNSCKRQAK